MFHSKWFYEPGTTTFAHQVFISSTFITKNLILKWPIFVVDTRGKICYFSDAIYSIKHNIKVLRFGILQIDVCLRIQNLKKIENWFTNKGAKAISVRGVFNKNSIEVRAGGYNLFLARKLL